MKSVIFSISFLLFSTTANAGPLGTHKGMAKGSIAGLTQVEGFTYTSKYAPKKSTLFDEYLYLFGPEGLCKVVGIGKSIDTTTAGTSLRSEYDSVLEALTTKYGTATNNYDFLSHGSIWKDYSDWMMALKLGDRHLSSYWTEIVLPDDLKSIGLSAKAQGQRKGYLTVGYEYTNMNTCTEIADKNKFDGL